MIKRILIFVFLSLQYGWSQQEDTLLSLSYQNQDLRSVLEQIETISDHRFFFQDSWINEYKELSGNYKEVDINTMLDAIFKDTLLNFFIFDNRVVMTKNNIIYDTLPDGFLIDTSLTNSRANYKGQNNKSIAFTNDIYSSSRATLKTIKIGKAIKGNVNQYFKLSGHIANNQTKKPLEDAIIAINGNDIGVRTNSEGFYELRLSAGNHIIEINALGMEEVKNRLIIYSDGKLDFTINEKIELLDEVVLQSEINKNVDEVVTKTKIDIEESKNIPLALGERDVLKVATTLPGITTAGEASTGYNVRGGKSDQNLILLDDAVLYSPQHFFGIFSALNPFAIGDANIYKGTIPVEYGGRLSSVFDLRTKDASLDKIKAEGSVGPVTGNLLFEIPVVKDKAGLMIGGRGAYANWILNSLDEESLENSEASFYDAIAKYNHQISKNSKIEATLYWSKDDFSITSDSLYIYENRAFSLRWNYRFNEKNSGKLNLSNSRYGFDIEFDGDSDKDFELGYNINETEVKFQFRNVHNSKLKFDYGLSSKLYAVNPGEIQPANPISIVEPLKIEKERALESAAFLGAEIDVSNKIKIDAGIRYSMYNALGESSQNVFLDGVPKEEASIQETLFFDRNEVIKTYGGPEYRLSGRYLILDNFSVKASYNKTFQFIHTLSNNTTVSPIDTWKLSDLNIKPQSSQQYALGLHANFDESAYELSLEGFYKRSKNILDFKTGAEILLNENIETQVLQGNGKAYGVEFLLKKQKGRLYGWLGYTYSRSFLQLDSRFREERVNNGMFFPSNFDKPHDFSVVANYKFTKRFSMTTNFVYQTGRPVTFPIGNFSLDGVEFAVFSDRNKFRIPDFYRLDIGINIEGNHKKKKTAHGFWTVSVYNVLGRNNPFSVFFVTENGDVKGLQSSIFSIPIPSITYNFKF